MEKNELQQQVLEKIHRGDIAPLPRWYFALRVVGVLLLALVILALAAFLASGIMFALRESGEQMLLGFGVRGFETFAELFPWTLLAIMVILAVVLEWALRSLRFAYRTPLLYLFCGVVALTALAGVVLDRTPLHATLLSQADEHALPLLGDWYEDVRAKHEDEGVFRGSVQSIATSTFMLVHDDRDADADDLSHVVMPPPGFDLSALRVGEELFVAGDVDQQGVVHAYGMQEEMRDMK